MPDRPDIHTLFIYLTEKCNLQCRYCYFRHKRARDLALPRLKRFLGALTGQGWEPRQFIISGGEPLLSWDRFQEAVKLVVGTFPGKKISMQTNGSALSSGKLKWIKEHGISLEFGIDGMRETTVRWRKGLGPEGFERVAAHIRSCSAAGILAGCNMTVHPQEAGKMVENFYFLRSLGLKSIDVTPAAFMAWEGAALALFKNQYMRLMDDPENRKTLYVGEDVQLIPPGYLDLSLFPGGQVLCGDAYLCLADDTKTSLSLWDHRAGEFLQERVDVFMRSYQRFQKKFARRAYTHRDYICSGFRIVDESSDDGFLHVREMIGLMQFLKRVHLSQVLDARRPLKVL